MMKESFFHTTGLDISLYLTYFLLVVSIAALLFFLGWGIKANIKKSKGLLIGISVLIFCVLVGYLTASSELSSIAVRLRETSNSVRWIGAGLFTFYCVFFGTVAAIVFTLIYSAFKNKR
jgi:NADH:ubiquinone oxidoreductase subunit 6 (subunit J)